MNYGIIQYHESLILPVRNPTCVTPIWDDVTIAGHLALASLAGARYVSGLLTAFLLLTCFLCACTILLRINIVNLTLIGQV